MEGGSTRNGDSPGSPRQNPGRQNLGTNQSGMRDFNERLVMSLLRQHGSMAKTEIARMTGLSAQTVSVIMRGLEADALLIRGSPQRGKVGQPSIPMSLNPDGAYFFGLKIGRRSSELVLIDFRGTIRRMRQHSYAWPTPEETIAFVMDDIAQLRQAEDRAVWDRIGGLGVAMPFELWNWADAAGAPAGAMDGWREIDMRRELSARCPFPVYLQNDATSACGAELVFGTPLKQCDFIYFYIGAFVGGGIALGGRLFGGRTGNAGALGSMPVPGPGGRTRQLIDVASISVLEKALVARGREAQHLWTAPDDWGDLGEDLERWIEGAAEGLADAIIAAAAVIDFEESIIEGWMPLSVRSEIVRRTRRFLQTKDSEGLSLPDVREGTVGKHARALGGASLPLAERFLVGAPSSPAHSL
ncbi:N-acetylglucosamine repressor [Nitratireductor thuwali]|uniref:N-acetylglucosamine repressor n=2 Tax=Nitratireductor thuwali TaxID=2267699 RepID=A0ABY5MLK7_9HYPH|nr:N-acetylglucosamine repressor [Nitratireductor thuwali]